MHCKQHYALAPTNSCRNLYNEAGFRQGFTPGVRGSFNGEKIVKKLITEIPASVLLIVMCVRPVWP